MYKCPALATLRSDRFNNSYWTTRILLVEPLSSAYKALPLNHTNYTTVNWYQKNYTGFPMDATALLNDWDVEELTEEQLVQILLERDPDGYSR